jgi:hypothetical protein
VIPIPTTAGYISKTLHSFVSILKFSEEDFGVPSINQRDGSANNMSDCFDFTQTPLGAPKWAVRLGLEVEVLVGLLA